MKLEIRIFLSDGKFDTKVKANVSVVIEGKLVIKGFKVVQGKNGVFVGNPSTKDKDGEYKDMVHPISSEGRTELYDAIISAYNDEIGKNAEESDFI